MLTVQWQDASGETRTMEYKYEDDADYRLAQLERYAPRDAGEVAEANALREILDAEGEPLP